MGSALKGSNSTANNRSFSNSSASSRRILARINAPPKSASPSTASLSSCSSGSTLVTVQVTSFPDAGKSTDCRAFLEPQVGHVLLGGKNVRLQSPHCIPTNVVIFSVIFHHGCGSVILSNCFHHGFLLSVIIHRITTRPLGRFLLVYLFLPK